MKSHLEEALVQEVNMEPGTARNIAEATEKDMDDFMSKYQQILLFNQSTFQQALQQALVQNQTTFLQLFQEKITEQLNEHRKAITKQLEESSTAAEKAVLKRIRRGFYYLVATLGAIATITELLIHFWH